MKNVWIEIFEEEKSCLWVEENCVFTEKLLNKINLYQHNKQLYIAKTFIKDAGNKEDNT
jgi:hypothetical protein